MEKRTLHDILNGNYKAVGVDIDDTMIPIGPEFVKYAHIFFKDRLKTKFEYQDYSWMVLEEITPMADAGITRKDISDMLKYMESKKIIEGMLPKIYCIATLKALSEKNSIYLVTSRGDNYYEDPVGMTNRWLDNVFAYQTYPGPEKVIYDPDKLKVAKELGIGLFFEDNPLIARDLLDAGIPVILFNAPWNVMDHHKDKRLLTEKAYDSKRIVLEHIARYEDRLLFRVPEWSYVFMNLIIDSSKNF